MSNLYIITTNWGTHKMTETFAKSLLLLEGIENIKIVVVNNSPDENKYFANWKFGEKVKVINSGENLGYAGGLNKGLDYALKDRNMKYVLITNNDIKFERTLIKKFLRKDSKDTILAPIILKRDSQIVQNTGGKISMFLGGTINVNKDVPLPELKIKKYDFLSGCMMFIPRNILEDVGLFDAEYIAYYEDADYCLRAKDLGYKLKICEDITIKHFQSVSTSKNIGFKRYLLARNSIIFAKKNYKFPKSMIFIIMSIIRGFIQNLKYLDYYLKGVKEGLLC